MTEPQGNCKLQNANCKFAFCILQFAILLTLAPGCASRSATPAITLATTTSAQDSGLLDMLVPLFREQTGVEAKVVAVGSGQAFQLGRRGDADVLLVHDPANEEKFMADGFGIDRRSVMHNDFILVGPAADPAAVKGSSGIAQAFTKLAKKEAMFISRGDESGTHQKERQVWRKAQIEPAGDWYIRAGTGMGAVLRMASEKRAYTMSDRGTFLSQRLGLDLVVLSEGDPLLINPYHVIVVNPDKHPHVHREQAGRFAGFLTSADTQKRIAEFGVDRFGEPLFHADGADR